MKTYATAVAALFAAATMATAGGIERRGDPSMILFEKGKNYLEFSAAYVHPEISGTPRAMVPGFPTGNIAKPYQSYSGGYKHQLNDKIALAFVIDEPVGASVEYQAPGAFFFTSRAEVSSVAFTGLAKYQATDRISAYGGIRYQGMEGSIRVQSFGGTFPNPYTLTEGKDFQFGYLLGAAYEIPDIALRFAVTYESEIKHDFVDNAGAPFSVKTPQAVTLHAQTGIAQNTLLFGSAKWREWTEFNVSPPDFAPNPIASGTSDTWTYELGIGQRFNDNWSGAFVLGYEKDQGDTVGNLSGTDGYMSYGLGVTYQTEKWKVTTGLRYIEMGSAPTSVAQFSGNSAIAFGSKFAFRF